MKKLIPMTIMKIMMSMLWDSKVCKNYLFAKTILFLIKLGVYKIALNFLFNDRLVYVKTTETELFLLIAATDPNTDYNGWGVRYQIDSCRWNIRAIWC